MDQIQLKLNASGLLGIKQQTLFPIETALPITSAIKSLLFVKLFTLGLKIALMLPLTKLVQIHVDLPRYVTITNALLNTNEWMAQSTMKIIT